MISHVIPQTASRLTGVSIEAKGVRTVSLCGRSAPEGIVKRDSARLSQMAKLGGGGGGGGGCGCGCGCGCDYDVVVVVVVLVLGWRHLTGVSSDAGRPTSSGTPSPYGWRSRAATTGFRKLTAHYSPLTFHNSLLTAHYSLLTTYDLLHTTD